MSDSPTRRTRLGAAAGLLGAATAFTFILGAGPAPSVFQLAGVHEDVPGNCDEAEHANDPECVGTPTDGSSTSTTIDDSSTSSTIDDSPSTTVPTPAGVRTIEAAGAGTVVVASDGTHLRLVAATPAPGWRVEVERTAGREIEVDFRNGTKRVQVDVELEDGVIRDRVRVRDDADDTDVRSEDGVVVRDDSDDQADDSSHSSDDSTVEDDHSSSGHGSDDSNDDSNDDDDGSSGHGSDDGSNDDSGSGGHGSDD